jgi:hypothetical protein
MHQRRTETKTGNGPRGLAYVRRVSKYTTIFLTGGLALSAGGACWVTHNLFFAAATLCFIAAMWSR